MLRLTPLALAAMLVAAPALAQLGLPRVEAVLPSLPLDVGRIAGAAGGLVGDATRLARLQVERLAGFVRTNRTTVEVDAQGSPARRGELLLTDPSPADLAGASDAGFTVIERGTIEGTGIAFARLAVSAGLSLAKAERRLRKRLPQASISADVLHFASGTATPGARGAAPPSPLPVGGTVGIIDGGTDPALAGPIVKGFANGAPAASAHGTAVAWLALAAGASRVVVADVYGRDPAGGNALAIARALGWMVAMGVPVVSISLTGPANPLLERSIAAAGARGTIVVAAAGNDGPAAPPAFPASYPQVIAVTAVDGRNRALIEAGRPLHLDYAAPGADLAAMGLKGRMGAVRGTSFAAPLAAARLAANVARSRVETLARADAEAIDLGARGPDKNFGRGLLCAACRPSR